MKQQQHIVERMFGRKSQRHNREQKGKSFQRNEYNRQERREDILQLLIARDKDVQGQNKRNRIRKIKIQ